MKVDKYMDHFDYSNRIQKLPPKYDFTLYTPSLGSAKIDDEEWAFFSMEDVYKKDAFAQKVQTEMTPMNLAKVSEFFGRLKDPKLIVEIGVMRNPDIPNVTKTLLDAKPTDCAYFGIDIENREYVRNYGTNVHVCQIDSGKTEEIKSALAMFETPIDFLFIDGWHTITQVGKELDLVSCVRKGGIIGLHDIAVHTGPNTWMDAFDPTKFEVHRFYAEGDWGIGFLVKLF